MLRAPVAITATHDVSQFVSRHADLADWLKRRALANDKARGSRTFVVCDGVRVVGYYALAAGSIEHAAAPKPVTRNMPRPVPAIVLGRLAVDEAYQGQGIGAGLLQDATLRSLAASEAIGARVLLCHAIDEAARAFYLRHGFMQSPFEELTVMLDLARVSMLIGDTRDA